MSKWIGIRVSAILTILGSAVMLLFAGLIVWTALRASRLETPVESPFPLKAMMVTLAVFFTAFSGWGIATAIGIFRRRGWARLSMIIFAVLLVGMGGSALVGILFIRIPETGNVSPVTMQSIRVGIAAFYGAMAVIGAWWLLLFNSSATKQYFAELPEPGSRPLSIAIIGWYLLLCAVGTATGAILRMPAILFGAAVTGWAALAVYTVFTAVEIYLGAGLLQLQESVRVASIVWFALMALNSVVTVALPGFASRMQIVQQALPAFLRAGQQQPPIEGTGGLILISTLIVAVPIWFLVRRREAFRA
ncbi:MAG TPA: hypothetical protein VGZ73_29410 [Bryobacteraceae bacterium]|jgi:hypothetical protein|nr:hypothetical protein [Bryobacteraceae bacterium]